MNAGYVSLTREESNTRDEVTLEMEGTPFFSLAELLQEAALQQAAERTQIGIIERDVDTADAVTLSSRPKLDAVDHVKEQTEELLASLLDEKAKNDALSRQIESVGISQQFHAQQ